MSFHNEFQGYSVVGYSMMMTVLRCYLSQTSSLSHLYLLSPTCCHFHPWAHFWKKAFCIVKMTISLWKLKVKVDALRDPRVKSFAAAIQSMMPSNDNKNIDNRDYQRFLFSMLDNLWYLHFCQMKINLLVWLIIKIWKWFVCKSVSVK